MKEVLIKSFVYPFYKAYLGFFILITVVFGVFMEIKQHLMIAEKILEKNTWFLALLLSFLIYEILQARHIKKLSQDPRYRQFQKLSFLSFFDFARHFAPVWLANQGLILLYSLLLFYVGIPAGAWIQLSLLVLFLILSLWASLYYNYLIFSKFIPETRISSNRIFKKKPFSFWFLFHLKENRPLLLLLIKALSLFLLSGFFYSYFSGGYDSRWLAFGLLISCFAHYPIWLEKWEFGEKKLYLFRSLPLKFGHKFRLEFIVFTILTLPESILILYQGRGIESKFDLFCLLVFWFGLNPGLFALCHWVQINNKFSILYLAFFGCFLAVIFGINPAILSLLMLTSFGISISSPFRI
ncbi:hypothetical protein FHS59_000318 [Algoriphagus iocasae]|uniref:Uncharacterized protein n=1 Tax=Algoriphagus iocasae TaxID=1836499 RepID=A0A841MD93_9BACT|nr:hypothetical protein [Algoriphagus iocasae]MBB6324703.1 hypothetical protein [Algoriphagus iocasae]